MLRGYFLFRIANTGHMGINRLNLAEDDGLLE